ncbi:hypothetical protein [Mycobacterium sp. URHB0021]
MNAFSVRPRTKFAAALMAAGVVSAASLVGVAENRDLPVLDIDVASASVITDALYGLGDAINGVASGVALANDASSSLPFDALTAFTVAAQNASLGPTLLSWLVQRYANPSDNYPWYSYPKEIKNFSIEPLAALLPYPLGPNGVDSGSIINTVNQIADAINNALAGLPDPGLGELGALEFWATDIGRTVVAVNSAVIAPVWMLYSTTYYLGYLPADVEATFESALQNPNDIPGLVSNLAYGLLSPDIPDGGLFGDLLHYASQPFTTLPGPIGEQATNIVAAISNNINNLLAQLPTPISPTPFPSATPGAQVAGASTLSSADPVEKKFEELDSTEHTPSGTPKDSAPAVAGDVDPDATPAADTDVSELKADEPVRNTVKSGNKVHPGDKFGSEVKGHKAENADAAEDKDGGNGNGNGTSVTTPGSNDQSAGGTTDPTGSPAGETGGADNSDSSDASGAA